MTQWRIECGKYYDEVMFQDVKRARKGGLQPRLGGSGEAAQGKPQPS